MSESPKTPIKYQDIPKKDKMMFLYSVLQLMNGMRLSLDEGMAHLFLDEKKMTQEKQTQIFEKDYSSVVKTLHNLYRTRSIELVEKCDDNEYCKSLIKSNVIN